VEAALVLKILNMIGAGMGWLKTRGITKDRAQALLDKAEADGDRDVTTAEVQAELDLLQRELDETAEAISEMPGAGDNPQ